MTVILPSLHQDTPITKRYHPKTPSPAPMTQRLQKPSLLDLILEVDPYPHTTDPLIHPVTKEKLIPFHALVADYTRQDATPALLPMGHIPLHIVKDLIEFDRHRQLKLFDFYPRPSPRDVDPEALRCVAFTEEMVQKGPEVLSIAMEAVTWYLRNKGSIKKQAYAVEDIYSVFADTRSAVFEDPRKIEPWTNIVFKLFRTVTPYFGTAWLGVSVIVYEGEGEGMRIWMQKRGTHVQYANVLDTTAGGAVECDATAMEGLIKEIGEEAGISSEICREYAKFAGDLHFYLNASTNPIPCKSSEEGYSLATADGVVVHLCYDLKRPCTGSPDHEATRPRVMDEEVADFIPMSVAQVREALEKRQFQPTAVPDLVFFLYRHGFIYQDNEPHIEDILARFAPRHQVAFPHQLTRGLLLE